MICKKCKKVIPDISSFCCFCGADQTKKKKAKQRRINGMGTVSKCPGRVKSWKALAPKDEKGNRPLIGYFATKQEANDALLAYKSTGTRNTKLNITLAELFDEWKSINYKNISKQTQDNYNAAYAKLIRLYSLKFREIRTADMQQIIDGNSHMSHSTLSKIKALLTQLYDYAMQNDVVGKNYANFIVLPHAEKAAKDCFNDVELAKIEKAAADGVPFADCILMMCYTGFRISEFLELTPFNYDKERNVLIGGKKTDAGRNRAVPVHPKILPYLLEWLDKRGQTIICKEDGTPYTANLFRNKRYYPVLDQIGVRRLSPHATRHTMATRLSAAGVRTEDIQKIMGHENYEITANTYIHQDIGSLEKAINKIV